MIKCEECKYWVRSDYQKRGDCRKKEPIVISDDCKAAWPISDENQGCWAGKPRAEGCVDIVFDGPPGHESGRFVEVEDSNGASISIGEWVKRDDGYWALRIPDPR